MLLFYIYIRDLRKIDGFPFPPTSVSLISMATSFSFTVSRTCASMFICIVLYKYTM